MMIELQDNQLFFTNDKGEEVVCDILFTFDSEETKKSYIVYTDNSKDKRKATLKRSSTQ